VHVCVCVCIRVCVRMHARACVCVSVHRNMYTCLYIHTNVYIHVCLIFMRNEYTSGRIKKKNICLWMYCPQTHTSHLLIEQHSYDDIHEHSRRHEEIHNKKKRHSRVNLLRAVLIRTKHWTRHCWGPWVATHHLFFLTQYDVTHSYVRQTLIETLLRPMSRHSPPFCFPQ